MICPGCNYQETRVIESRHNDEKIRRRRECARCELRFTTNEELKKYEKKGGQ
jgi:transcriptional repressor NrdR